MNWEKVSRILKHLCLGSALIHFPIRQASPTMISSVKTGHRPNWRMRWVRANSENDYPKILGITDQQGVDLRDRMLLNLTEDYAGSSQQQPSQSNKRITDLLKEVDNKIADGTEKDYYKPPSGWGGGPPDPDGPPDSFSGPMVQDHLQNLLVLPSVRGSQTWFSRWHLHSGVHGRRSTENVKTGADKVYV